MTDVHTQLRDRLRSLERDFKAAQSGDKQRLYGARESLGGLSELVEGAGHTALATPCEIANKILGILLMEGSLSEARAVQVVIDLIAYIEGQATGGEGQGPGGVFHVVHSKKIGDILLEKGLIRPEQLHEALVLQRVSKGKRVGELLVAMNVIDPRVLEQHLGEQRDETRRNETRRAAAPTGRTTSGDRVTTEIPELPGLRLADPASTEGGFPPPLPSLNPPAPVPSASPQPLPPLPQQQPPA